MPRYNGAFDAGLSKEEFLKQTEQLGWVTDEERNFVSQAYDILAQDRVRGHMLDNILEVDLWKTDMMFRQSEKARLYDDFEDDEYFNGPIMRLVNTHSKQNVQVDEKIILDQHQKVMGYPISERVHRLAEDERAKGKPRMRNYIKTNEDFARAAVTVGWGYEEDVDFMLTLYDTFADSPEHTGILFRVLSTEAWDPYFRKSLQDEFIKYINENPNVTAEQKEKLLGTINNSKWDTLERDDEELESFYEQAHGIPYGSSDSLILPAEKERRQYLTDLERYNTRIQNDEKEQRKNAKKNKADSFANNYTREQFLELAILNGWVLESDMELFGPLYDELSEDPAAKGVLIDIVNIPVFDLEEQKKLKPLLAASIKLHAPKAEGTTASSFDEKTKEWLKIDPTQEMLDDAYQEINGVDREEQRIDYDADYSFSKKDFLKKAFDNGWEKKSDQADLEILYNYAKDNANSNLGDLLKRIMENDVSTYEGRRKMADDINKTLKEKLPTILPGGIITKSNCKDALHLHSIADKDGLAEENRGYFDEILPRARKERKEEAEFKALRNKMINRGWSGNNDKSFAQFVFKTRKFIENNEKYSDNEEIINALDEAENSKVNGKHSNYQKGEAFNKLVTVLENNNVTADDYFMKNIQFYAIDFKEKNEKAYLKDKAKYLEDKAREELKQKKLEEEQRKRELEEKKREEQIKLREEKIKLQKEEELKGRQYEVENDDEDFYIEGGAVTEYGKVTIKPTDTESTEIDDEDFFIEDEESLSPESEIEGEPQIIVEEKPENNNTKQTQEPKAESHEQKSNIDIDGRLTEIRLLRDIKKQLDTKHRYGFSHEDSQAIINLRSSLQKLIDAKVKHITEPDHPDVLSATGGVYLDSRAYLKKIRDDARVKPGNRKWKPTSNMGRERYGGAQALEDLTGRALGFEEMGEMFPDTPETSDTTAPEEIERRDSLAEIEFYSPVQNADKHMDKYLESKKAVSALQDELDASNEMLEEQNGEVDKNDKNAINSPKHKQQVIPLVAKVVAAQCAADWERKYIENGGKPLSQNAFNNFTEKITATLPQHKAFMAYVNDPDLSATDLLEKTIKDNGKSIYAGMISTNKSASLKNTVKQPRGGKAKITEDIVTKNTEQIKRSNSF